MINKEEIDDELELVCEACEGTEFKPVCWGDECYDKCVECGLVSH